MEVSKIRIKIGEHEFEASGPPESVQAQFEAFQKLIISVPIKQPENPVIQDEEEHSNQRVSGGVAHVPLEKILRVSGRIVSLTAIPVSTEDAALLIMLGHKDLRNNESVTGQEIGDGLSQSGRPVPRTDRIMDKPIASAYVLKSGFKRSTRYRLSNIGHQKALATARELIATLPK
ncbi:MAG: hypothetical protein P4N59_25505 [Negativicutes bacterium]|nr:hypothetical protein [Negativicutes bacterium]